MLYSATAGGCPRVKKEEKAEERKSTTAMRGMTIPISTSKALMKITCMVNPCKMRKKKRVGGCTEEDGRMYKKIRTID